MIDTVRRAELPTGRVVAVPVGTRRIAALGAVGDALRLVVEHRIGAVTIQGHDATSVGTDHLTHFRKSPSS